MKWAEERYPIDANHYHPYEFYIESTEAGIRDPAFWADVVAWCRDTLGPKDFVMGKPRWEVACGIVGFREANDALAFKMRWC